MPLKHQFPYWNLPGTDMSNVSLLFYYQTASGEISQEPPYPSSFLLKKKKIASSLSLYYITQIWTFSSKCKVSSKWLEVSFLTNDPMDSNNLFPDNKQLKKEQVLLKWLK